MGNYTKQQGQHYMDRYHNDLEFRKRIIRHVHNSRMRYPFRVWANSVIQSHRQRGIQLKITRIQLEELASKSPYCAFCGCILKYGIQNGIKKWHFDSASADRIDNIKPFSIKNIQIICVRCNSSKAQMNQSEFCEYIKTLYINLCQKP